MDLRVVAQPVREGGGSAPRCTKDESVRLHHKPFLLGDCGIGTRVFAEAHHREVLMGDGIRMIVHALSD